MGGKKDEDKDLRKEVEMTEHTDSIEKVCQQYQTCGEKGLTDSAVEDVSPAIFSDQGSTGRLGRISVRRSFPDYSNGHTVIMRLKLYTSLEIIDRNRPKIILFSNSF